MRAFRAHAALGILLLLVVGCAGTPQGRAKNLANAVTNAIIQDNPGVVSHDLRDASKSVSRAEVGVLSDEMNALGNYQGLTLLAFDAQKNEFDFRATFAKGSKRVVVRLDTKNNLSAYRVF